MSTSLPGNRGGGSTDAGPAAERREDAEVEIGDDGVDEIPGGGERGLENADPAAATPATSIGRRRGEERRQKTKRKRGFL